MFKLGLNMPTAGALPYLPGQGLYLFSLYTFMVKSKTGVSQQHMFEPKMDSSQ